jgi:hypothetical protein
LYVGFQAYLLFGAGTEWLRPNYAKFRFVLPILKDDHASNLEPATDCAQPNSIAANVESMNKFGIGVAGNIAAGDSYGQYRLCSVETPLIVHRSCVCCQSCQSCIRGIHCHFLYL